MDEIRGDCETLKCKSKVRGLEKEMSQGLELRDFMQSYAKPD